MIVDDMVENIKLLKYILIEEGYNIKVAKNGKRALELVRKEPLPDLILLDVMMPEMDGYEVCAELKNNNITKNIPVIFVTAKNEREDEKMGFDVGAVDYVSKPISRITVCARVKTHLQLKELMDNLSSQVEEETKLRLYQEKLLMKQSKQAAMGEMIDAIGHQWVQPLTIMSMNVEMLSLEFEENLVDKKYMEDFTTNFQSQVTHLKETMKEFRTFLRPCDNTQPFVVDKAIDVTLVLVKDEFIKNTIEIKTNLQKGIILEGSETEFKHILINLLNNAKDAFIELKIPQRIIEISLYENENCICIDVCDNAGGIPIPLITEIFKPNVTSKEEGTGIGLYMSQQIAEKLGGYLRVKNIGNGAKFSFVKEKQNKIRTL